MNLLKNLATTKTTRVRLKKINLLNHGYLGLHNISKMNAYTKTSGYKYKIVNKSRANSDTYQGRKKSEKIIKIPPIILFL